MPGSGWKMRDYAVWVRWDICITHSHGYGDGLLQIMFLEDSDGSPTVEINVESETVAKVDMICRGSK